MTANGSIDYSVMRIDSIHWPELALQHPSRCADDAVQERLYPAWHLRKQVVRYGDT
ncbi:hypothetical protein [Paraburkholderia phymatum]|uniref:hypothetical protein n=1 Tax=Paraburkholderia phymatum TaxID=148447 RepID=UPI003D172C27